MPARAETEQAQVSEDVSEIPAVPEFPREIEKGANLSVRQQQVTAQVTDDQGKPLIQSPANQSATVQIPATDDQLEDWAKGDASESLTWYGRFWLRMKAKALTLGKKISRSSEPSQPAGKQ
jgi:hypothetical protein